MNIMDHKFKVGEKVSFQKRVGIILAQERSYGLPTYQIDFNGETLTLCERDIENS